MTGQAGVANGSNRRFYLIGFAVLLILDTLAQVSFKLAAEAAAPLGANLEWLLRVLCSPWIYVALGCYVGTFFTWMTLLLAKVTKVMRPGGRP